jgi:hypothetical protein
VARIKILAWSLLAIAIPATAQTFDFSIGASAPACLSIGNVSYRAVANSAPANYTVRLDASAASPDIRIQIADTADAADFVFVDDGNAPPACRHGGGAIKSVKIVTAAADLVAAVTTGFETADYRIYVRSRRLAPETAAALFAAARSPRTLAGRAPDRLN